jgi:hypothetical protein
LAVTINLHFRGDPAAEAWAEGLNTRFITFTRPSSASAYRQNWATGP